MYEESIDSLDEVDEITAEEVTEASVKALKRSKASGIDTMTAEHLIEAGGTASNEIARCLQDILRTADIPRNFTLGMITPVYKGHGADPALVDNYRDISVLTLLCKIFEKILVNALTRNWKK